jgi:hypothetical protein
MLLGGKPLSVSSITCLQVAVKNGHLVVKGRSSFPI